MELSSVSRKAHCALLESAIIHCGKDRDQDHSKGLARSIEQCILDYALESVKQTSSLRQCLEAVYKHKVNDLLHNLYRNPALLEHIQTLHADGRLSELPRMHPHELFPAHWKEIIDKKQNTESSLNNLPTVHLPDMVCRKCKGVDYYYYSMQTRSGDEPETIFLTCSKCGHKIKR